MSSPVQDDADKQLIRALPWVSDPRRQEEERRLEEEVIEAAKRLEREASALSYQTPAQPRTDAGFRLAVARPNENNGNLEEINRRIWAAITPDLLPPPPQEGMGLPGLRMAAGFVGAIAMAAAIALVVANVVQIPTIGASVSSEDSSSTAALENLNRVAATQARMQPADEPSVPAGTLLAAIPTNEIAVAKSAAPILPPSSEPESARPVIATPTTAAAPEPRTAISLTRNEIASLLKRGQDLIAAGDIASGRLMLAHVAEAGDAEACFTLAGTFDAAVLAKLRVVGVQPDAAKARAWYSRAAELGSLEARQRLQQSALR
jgi:hypothetical protein